MRIRITRATDGPTTVLYIAGEFTGEGVRELELLACTAGSLRLDLTHLLRADASGLSALRRLAATGAELVNIPLYFELLLEL